MTFRLVLQIAVLLAGAGVALYGVRVLVTGRPTDRARHAFRTTRDAGMYPLVTGSALVLLAVGQWLSDRDGVPTAWAYLALVAALVLASLGFLRYRPRRPQR